VKVFKLYDACCDKCNNWYASTFKQPETRNKNEAVKEMKANGWKCENGKTICHNCK
jgi:hypothetical protein